MADQITATYADGVLEVRIPTTGREQGQQQEDPPDLIATALGMM